MAYRIGSRRGLRRGEEFVSALGRMLSARRRGVARRGSCRFCFRLIPSCSFAAGRYLGLSGMGRWWWVFYEMMIMGSAGFGVPDAVRGWES